MDTSHLAASLDGAQPFATSLLDTLIQGAADLRSPASRLRVVRESGQIIAALPPERWLVHIESVTGKLDLPPGMLHLEVVDAGADWTNHPAQSAAQRIADIAERTRREPSPQSSSVFQAMPAHVTQTKLSPSVPTPPGFGRRPGSAIESKRLPQQSLRR